MKAKIDAILNKYVSRKLMVFVVASFGLFSATLTSSDWCNNSSSLYRYSRSNRCNRKIKTEII